MLLQAATTNSVESLRQVVAEWSGAQDEAAASERAERLRERRRLDVCPTVSGMVRVEGELDPESGEHVMTALQAIVDSELRSGGPVDTRTPAQRRADALGELASRYLDSPDRPRVGGERPHVTVTVDVKTLERRTGVGTLDHAGFIHPGAARRLSCDAQVIRVVLSGESLPLDVGRRTPVVPPHHRRRW